MSSHRALRLLGFLTIGIPPVPCVAAAQTAAAARANVVALVESLASVDRRQELRDEQNRARADTVVTGALQVVITGQAPPALRQAVPIAWLLLRRRYGRLADSVTGSVAIAPGTNEDPGFEQLHFTPRPTAEAWSGAPLLRAARSPADSFATTIADAAARSLWPRAGPQLRNWLEGVPPYPATSPSDLRELYLELVTNAWHTGRECFEGGVAACRRALGLVASTRPGTDWYDPDDRRVLVRRLAEGTPLRDRSGQVQACVAGGQLETCDFLLAQLSPEWIPPSLSATARRSLVAVALHHGGPGGFDRLGRSSSRPIGDQLAFAADVPLDTVIAEWRAQILRARPHVIAVSVASGWMAFSWALGFSLLALGSTRWR